MAPPDKRRQATIATATDSWKRYLALSAAILVLAAGGVVIFHLDTTLNSTRAALERTRTHLTNTIATLEQTAASLAQRTTERNSLQASLTQAQQQLAALNQKLAGTQLQALAETNIADNLNQCLAGVQQALNAISVGDNSKAVSALDSVSGACQQAQENNGVATAAAGGPVYPFDFPDPDIVRVGATYYGYATNSALGNIQMIDSSDITHWQPLGTALARLPSWSSRGFTWAPGVVQLGGQYVMYYATAVAISGLDCLSVATAGSPSGPFDDSSSGPLVCQANLDGDIDPDPLVGSDGVPYLVWKSNNPAGIWAAPLSADGLSLAGSPAQILSPSLSWENGLVEGPAMIAVGGAYYLFYSANDWKTAYYEMGMAICSSPMGPCSKTGSPVFASSGGAVAGPGGPAPFSDRSGNLYMAFHGWIPGKVGYPNSRELFVRRMAIDGNSVSFTNL